MNERFKLLAREAEFSEYDLHIQGDNFQKFAELIVQECSKVIRHGGQRKGAFGNEDLRPSEIATMIEEHFGVEE
jgi:hypothetical protein